MEKANELVKEYLTIKGEDYEHYALTEEPYVYNGKIDIAFTWQERKYSGTDLGQNWGHIEIDLKEFCQDEGND